MATHEAIDQALKRASDDDLAHYAAAPVRATVGWEGLTEAEQLALRASNLLARRARTAATRATEQAAIEARRAAAMDAYRQDARSAFPGNDADFARVWPGLRDQWLVEQTRTALGVSDRALAQKRAAMAGTF